MKNKDGQVRALCLLSSGLDSHLAASLLGEQGIRLRAITFLHPLHEATRANAVARWLGIEHSTEDLTPSLVAVLSRHRGTPSIAYQVEMMRKARVVMEDERCDFILTGDVLNQYLPSQTMESFHRIDRASGCADRVVRPLCAKRLPATLPEREGWVDRQQFLEIQGPERTVQQALAKRFELPVTERNPAQPCLTDEAFLVRAHDLRDHEGLRGSRALRLLRLGRHFRLGASTKLVVGRNERENAEIEGGAELYDLLLTAESGRGPSALLPFTATEEQVKLAASICLRYSDVQPADNARVRVRSARERWEVDSRPASLDEIERLRIDSSRNNYGG
jgi:hypothetical protein